MSEPSFRAVYVISVAAQLSGMHPQTLRNYERSGLLDPSRTTGGSRRYSEHDLVRLRRIQDLTNAGINLEGVKRILMLEAELDVARAALAQLSDRARESVEETHRHYRRDLVPVPSTVAVIFDPRNNLRR
ncbi:MAG: helix-turn-helix transcriptional regulator [Actinomycetota bacterium]